MNLIDAEVLEVLGEPHEKYGKWWVKVRTIDMGGRPQEESIMCQTKEQALAIGEGHVFQH